MAKDKEYIKLIHTAKWLRLRKAKLTACPLCERCEQNGIIRSATEVHHVKPVEDALSEAEKGRLMYDPHNLMALCHDCHVEVHRQMGRSGKAHAKRRAAEQLERFRKKYDILTNVNDSRPGGPF